MHLFSISANISNSHFHWHFHQMLINCCKPHPLMRTVMLRMRKTSGFSCGQSVYMTLDKQVGSYFGFREDRNATVTCTKILYPIPQIVIHAMRLWPGSKFDPDLHNWSTRIFCRCKVHTICRWYHYLCWSWIETGSCLRNYLANKGLFYKQNFKRQSVYFYRWSQSIMLIWYSISHFQVLNFYSDH